MTARIVPLVLVHVAGMITFIAVATWGYGRVFSLRRTWASVRRAPFDGAMVRYALPLAVAELVNSFLAQTNVLVLGKLRPVEDVGVYAACVVLANAVSYVRGAFDTVVAPVAAEAWAQGDKARLAANIKLMSRLVLLFAVPLAGLFIVGGRSLLALHGPDFVRGARTVADPDVRPCRQRVVRAAGWVLLASGRSKTGLANNLVALAVNIGLCLFLVPRLGIEGAAAAATLAVIALHAAQSIEAWVIARAHPLSAGFARLWSLGTLVIGTEIGLDRVLGGSDIGSRHRAGGRRRGGVPGARLGDRVDSRARRAARHAAPEAQARVDDQSAREREELVARDHVEHFATVAGQVVVVHRRVIERRQRQQLLRTGPDDAAAFVDVDDAMDRSARVARSFAHAFQTEPFQRRGACSSTGASRDSGLQSCNTMVPPGARMPERVVHVLLHLGRQMQAVDEDQIEQLVVRLLDPQAHVEVVGGELEGHRSQRVGIDAGLLGGADAVEVQAGVAHPDLQIAAITLAGDQVIDQVRSRFDLVSEPEEAHRAAQTTIIRQVGAKACPRRRW